MRAIWAIFSPSLVWCWNQFFEISKRTCPTSPIQIWELLHHSGSPKAWILLDWVEPKCHGSEEDASRKLSTRVGRKRLPSSHTFTAPHVHSYDSEHRGILHWYILEQTEELGQLKRAGTTGRPEIWWAKPGMSPPWISQPLKTSLTNMSKRGTTFVELVRIHQPRD